MASEKLEVQYWNQGLKALEAEVAERLVGFCHAVNFVTLFHGAATAFGGFHQLIGQTQGHGLLAALFGGFFQPAHGQGHTTHRTHFDRHLVVGTANAAGFHLNHGLDVADGHVESLQRVFARVLFLDLLQRTVNNTLCDGLFAALHDYVHEFGEINIAKFWIRKNFTFRDFATTWHFFTSLLQLASFMTPRELSNPHLLDRRNYLHLGHFA